MKNITTYLFLETSDSRGGSCVVQSILVEVPNELPEDERLGYVLPKVIDDTDVVESLIQDMKYRYGQWSFLHDDGGYYLTTINNTVTV
jgi:hypothetical protein